MSFIWLGLCLAICYDLLMERFLLLSFGLQLSVLSLNIWTLMKLFVAFLSIVQNMMSNNAMCENWWNISIFINDFSRKIVVEAMEKIIYFHLLTEILSYQISRVFEIFFFFKWIELLICIHFWQLFIGKWSISYDIHIRRILFSKLPLLNLYSSHKNFNSIST